MTDPALEAEARDPGTSPERLQELTERHPALRPLIFDNPSCPEVARQWIRVLDPGRYPEAPTPDPGTAGADAGDAASPDADAIADAPTVVFSPGSGSAQESTSPDALAPNDARTDPGTAESDGVTGASTSSGSPPAAGPGSAAHAASTPRSAPTPGAPPYEYGAIPPQPDAASDPAASNAAPTVVPVTGNTDPARYDAPAPSAPGAPVYAGAAGDAGTGGATGTGGAAAASSTAAPQEPGTDQDDGGAAERRRSWWACGGCLLVIAILIVVLGFVARSWLQEDDGSYQRTTETSEASEGDDGSESDEEPADDEEEASPAPEDAQELDAFVAPSGNISCKLDGDSVGCTVQEYNYPEDLESCDAAFSIRLDGENAGPSCNDNFGGESLQELPYEQSAKNGNVACTSTADGMTCWNTRTGNGFNVNKSGYETF